MQKTILITGSTDGIGLETVKRLANQGHHILLHGRNKNKVEQVEKILSDLVTHGRIDSYVADLSRMKDVIALAEAIIDKHDKLDILINNAGVYKTASPITLDGLDSRFAVNTLAPYWLIQQLHPLLAASARVINLASAAQAPVNLEALTGKVSLSDDFEVYAQSKLALIMWSRAMAQSFKEKGPTIIAVNPGSLLATKMVKEAFGLAGNDIGIGADILIRLALRDEFTAASGQYFDNDEGQFTQAHPDVYDRYKSQELMGMIEAITANLMS